MQEVQNSDTFSRIYRGSWYGVHQVNERFVGYSIFTNS